MEKQINKKRKIKTIPPEKGGRRARRKKPQSSSAPVIIGCVAGMFFLLMIIIIAANRGDKPGTGASASQADIKNEQKKTVSSKTDTKAVKNEKIPKKIPLVPKNDEPQGTVNFNQAFKKKPGEELPVASSSEPQQSTPPAEESPSETKPAETAPKKMVKEGETVISGTPKEMSISFLKRIGGAYKDYAIGNQGRMPIEFFQLNMEADKLISPLTNKKYIMAVKGGTLAEAAETVVIREAQAVDGVYLCLFGNGEVKEVASDKID